MAESTFNPRELREAAERTRRESMALSNSILPVDSGVGMLARVKRHEMLADYVLANVQENDEDRQPDCEVRIGDAVELLCRFSGVSIKYSNAWADVLVGLSNSRPTRGEFRNLCRALRLSPAEERQQHARENV